MMQRLSLSLLLTVLLACSIVAQNKILTMEEATGQNPKLFPTSLTQLQWMGNSGTYMYVTKNTLIAGRPGRINKDSILPLDSLNSHLPAMKEEKLKRFPNITILDTNAFIFTWKSTLWKFELKNRQLSVAGHIAEKSENVDIEKKKLVIAFTKENNLFISLNGEEKQITNELNQGIVYGSSRVHRNEFGITKGTFWSPDGNFLAFYRMDETMVADYPLVNIDNRIAKLENTKYPMAGMTSHQVTLGVYDLRSGKTIYLKTENPFSKLLGVTEGTEEAKSEKREARSETRDANDHYLTNITWSPDEKYIYIAVLNRDQNHLLLNKYSVETGDLVKTLFEEKSDKYVEPLNELFFIHNDPSKFIWQSQRDGFNHLYLYDAEGKMIKQLTQGNWVVKDLIGVNNKATMVFFMANKDNPLDNLLYRVNLKSGEIFPVSTTPGNHRCQVSPDGQYILDYYSSLTIPAQYRLLDEKGKMKEMLLENGDPLKNYNLGQTSVFSIKGDGNNDLYCRLIKPAGFDSTKKYPVVIYVYGGPHSQMVTDSWLGGGGLFLNYLAEQGYVVFTLDNRGTSNRGLAFEQAIFRNLGTVEVDDQMKGVQYLKSLAWVDTARIGINGWSYGGFMAMSMMLKHPGVFKTVVVGGPVIDWKYYEVMYGERYMDTPESNPDGYKNASLLNFVNNLKGKLLIIQGYQDGTVVPQNGLSFIKKCVDEGIQLDYFIYPGHEHNVRGKDRVHLNQKIVNYFKDFL